MQIELPIFRQISRDARLAPRAFQIWRAAIELLDVVEWRELKHWEIEKSLDVDQSTVSRALSTLVGRGYLCRQEATRTVTTLYRVPLSRRRCDDDSTHEAVAEVTEVVVPQEHGDATLARRTRGRMISRGVL